MQPVQKRKQAQVQKQQASSAHEQSWSQSSTPCWHQLVRTSLYWLGMTVLVLLQVKSLGRVYQNSCSTADGDRGLLVGGGMYVCFYVCASLHVHLFVSVAAGASVHNQACDRQHSKSPAFDTLPCNTLCFLFGHRCHIQPARRCAFIHPLTSHSWGSTNSSAMAR